VHDRKRWWQRSALRLWVFRVFLLIATAWSQEQGILEVLRAHAVELVLELGAAFGLVAASPSVRDPSRGRKTGS